MGWRFPLTFGGPDTTHDIEHMALLDALSPGWDVGEDTELYVETRVDALAATMVWAVNRRVANQNHPTRMMENLPVWEESCSLRPETTDLDTERRARLAAKLRGIAGNALVDLEDAARDALGINFSAFLIVDEADWVTYWPGLNPGPPGYEFSSNRATIGIQMNQDGLTEGEFRRKRAHLIDTIDHMRPSWLTYVTGFGVDFVLSVGVIGQTVL